MHRFFEVLLLLTGAALLVTGIATYPNVHGLVLLGMVAVGLALLVPVGIRTAHTAGVTR